MKEQQPYKTQGNSDVRESLTQNTGFPSERIQYYAEADLSVLKNVRRGIFFVMAFWSGPARIAFRNLTNVLLRLDPQGELAFIVVETDGAMQIADHPEINRRFHGYGETAWVRNGVIQYWADKERTTEQLITWTKNLLEMP